MEVRLKGVMCPRCIVESERIDINNGENTMHIFCYTCNTTYTFTLDKTTVMKEAG